MVEPQGTVFFLILMVVFAVLLTWLVIAKHAVFRVLAACLAFIPAMLFGVAAVNRYYNYYQTWGSIVADFTNQAWRRFRRCRISPASRESASSGFRRRPAPRRPRPDTFSSRR